MKKMIIVLVFIAFVFGIYYFQNDKGYEPFQYRDDFNDLDKEFWYAAKWNSGYFDVNQVEVNRGVISLKINETDEGPYLLSKPIHVEPGSVLTVKRRVQLKPGTDAFAGGFALLETSDVGVIPSILNDEETQIGNGIVLVEYITEAPRNSKRPGENTFRVLPRTWHIQESITVQPSALEVWFNKNYALVPAKFNQWVEETLTYDSNTGLITYDLDGDRYQVKGPLLKTGKVRLYIHGYGFGLDHEVIMDWLEVKVD